MPWRRQVVRKVLLHSPGQVLLLHSPGQVLLLHSPGQVLLHSLRQVLLHSLRQVLLHSPGQVLLHSLRQVLLHSLRQVLLHSLRQVLLHSLLLNLPVDAAAGAAVAQPSLWQQVGVPRLLRQLPRTAGIASAVHNALVQVSSAGC
jgi:hypothetical protein